jgi:hypothetical protein
MSNPFSLPQDFEHHDVVELESGRFVNCGAGGSVGEAMIQSAWFGLLVVENGKKQEWKVVKNLKSVRGKER